MVFTMTHPASESVLRTDPTAQLLLLLAREILSPEQIERARFLAGDVEDWNEFVRLAHVNFSLPFLCQHLPDISPAGLPPTLAPMLRQASTVNAIHHLQVLASLVSFHTNCIVPVRARHIYLKGPALATAIYYKPSLRICRDIDVLVARESFADVSNQCLASEFKIVLNKNEGIFASDPKDIDFLIRHSDVLSVVDKTGQHFELHRKIEKQSPIFRVSNVLASAESLKVAGQSIRAMGIDYLFCYVSYHHSRHHWSRLHWVADIHALISSPKFNVERVIELAKRLGLENTVKATIAFARLTGNPDAWGEHLGQSNEGAFLEACLRGLPGDSVFEMERGLKDHNHFYMFDFANLWQVDPRRRLRFWVGSALHRLSPTYDQYLKKRRSRAFEFLYVTENAAAIAGNVFARLRGR